MSKSTKSLKVLFPMSANILTVGHIRCLEWLSEGFDWVFIGLLDSEAMKDYKEERVPFKDRLVIMRKLALAFSNVSVTIQHSLDPSPNIDLYLVDALASGDGFEPVEEEAIKRYNLKRIDIKLSGEKSKKYSSTQILERAK